MNEGPILSRHFLIQSLPNIICHICYEPAEEMLVCTGACQSYFCNLCILERRQELISIVCPNRCCDQSELQPFSTKVNHYFCPYNKKECTQPIISQESFWQHCQFCPFATKQTKQQLKNRRQYKCKRGHRLYFITKKNQCQIYYNTFSSAHKRPQMKCSYCNDNSFGKSICLQCGDEDSQDLYCIKCRPLPWAQKCCLMNHQILKYFKKSAVLECKFCNRLQKNNGKYSYQDQECQFEICTDCYRSIPEYHNLFPYQNTIPKQLDIRTKYSMNLKIPLYEQQEEEEQYIEQEQAEGKATKPEGSQE